MSIEQARRTRRLRAKTLKRLEEGALTLSELLERPHDAIQGAPLWGVLLRTPNLGRGGARSVCERANVWPLTKIGDLSVQARVRLIEALPERVR